MEFSDAEVADAFVYVMSRYLVNRQEQIDLSFIVMSPRRRSVHGGRSRHLAWLGRLSYTLGYAS